MTTRMTEILNALKANKEWRAIKPDGTKWCVYDFATRQVILDRISHNTVHALSYSDNYLVQQSDGSFYYNPGY
jgi:hypothetical protein